MNPVHPARQVARVELAAGAIEAAAARLRGQVVATPLVGAPLLPGFSTAGLVVKLEVLQPAGSIWFRGALHALLRELGARRALAVADRARPALAWTTAGAALGFAVQAFVHGPVSAAQAQGLAATTERWTACPDADSAAAQADALVRTRGHRRSTDPRDPDVALGLATAGLELAHELPHDCEVVHVADGLVASAVAAGLRTGRPDVAVRVAAPLPPPEVLRLGAAVLAGLRVDADDLGLRAVAEALAMPPGRRSCAVLSE